MNESVTPSGEPERWLPVVGYEGLYEVSDLGRVRRSCGGSGAVSGRILKPQGPTKGHPYLTVQLFRDGQGRTLKIHILVARAFLGPRPEKLDVCHGPGRTLDNRLVNLSYGTRAKNAGPDKRRDGTAGMNRGSRHGSAKLNEEIVSECRVRAAAGESVASLARDFGVMASPMRNAITGKTWRHVPSPVELPVAHRAILPSGAWYGVRISVPIRAARGVRAARPPKSQRTAA